MKINKKWHQIHPMPENPTIEQRIAWHIEHTKHCKCREMPAAIQDAIKKRTRKIN